MLLWEVPVGNLVNASRLLSFEPLHHVEICQIGCYCPLRGEVGKIWKAVGDRELGSKPREQLKADNNETGGSAFGGCGTIQGRRINSSGEKLKRKRYGSVVDFWKLLCLEAVLQASRRYGKLLWSLAIFDDDNEQRKSSSQTTHWSVSPILPLCNFRICPRQDLSKRWNCLLGLVALKAQSLSWISISIIAGLISNHSESSRAFLFNCIAVN